jgi:hypothetical protein
MAIHQQNGQNWGKANGSHEHQNPPRPVGMTVKSMCQV